MRQKRLQNKISAASFLAAFTFASAGSLHAQPARVVLIHGRAQTERETEAMRSEWVSAFLQGQKKLVGRTPDSSHVVFVAYQDLFRSDRHLRVCKEGEYATLGLGEALKTATKSLADALSRVEGVSTAVANTFLSDTRDYLSNVAVRCAVNKRLLEALGDSAQAGRSVLVAHSMGGLVALSSLDTPAGNSPKLRVGSVITIGSQFRVPEMVEHLTSKYGRPYTKPLAFGVWTDFRGRLDAVSPGKPSGIWTVPYPERTFVEIDTDPKHPHAVTGYLMNSVVAERIRNEWCRLSGGGSGCAP